jgi:hypothetical protein
MPIPPDVTARTGVQPLTFHKKNIGHRTSDRRSVATDAADVPLRRVDAARHHHAEALRLREDRGRLRLHLRLLHHPDAARRVPQPHARVDRREARALAERGVKELLLISQDTTFYGIDRRSAARSRRCCAS